MTIGQRIRELRKAYGLNQKELAEALGLSSQATVSMIENGENMPSILVATNIAKLFNVSLDDLLSSTDQTEAEIVHAPA